ncbi:Coagulation factor X [Halotydeus destructor]|nr:Coagulation factor X [Halotydeus destructor]
MGLLFAATLLLTTVTGAIWGQSCICGTNSLGTRIIGGHEAEPAKFPWMAALVQTNGHQFCAGALINDRYILTAAHCSVVPLNDIRVGLGIHDLKEAPPVTREVEAMYVHPRYTGKDGNYRYDIALFKLKSPVPFNARIQPVCVTPPSLEGFDNLIASGWGKTEWGGSTVTRLREVELTEVPLRDCQKSLGRNRVNEDHLCTQDPGRNVCQGDSGGPLVTLQNGYYYEAGIVSWGIRCGVDNNYPSVYTRVSKFYDWIRRTARDANWCSDPRPVPMARSNMGGRNGFFNFPSMQDNLFKFFLG